MELCESYLCAEEDLQEPPLHVSDRPFAPARIIRCGEFDEWQDASRQAAALALESRRLQELNHVEVEASRQAGYDAGYESGLAAAQSEYASRVVGHAAQAALSWQQLVPAISTAVMDCLRQMLGELDQVTHINGRIRTLLYQACPQGNVTIRTHPLSITTTQTLLDEMCASFPDIQLLRAVGDANLQIDDMIIETPTAIIDARLPTQLAAIERGVNAALAAISDLSENEERKLAP